MKKLTRRLLLLLVLVSVGLAGCTAKKGGGRDARAVKVDPRTTRWPGRYMPSNWKATVGK